MQREWGWGKSEMNGQEYDRQTPIVCSMFNSSWQVLSLSVFSWTACRDYNEFYKTEGEHPPRVSNLPTMWRRLMG